jgi:hypothetical protein
MPPHPSGEIDLEGTVKTATPGFPGSRMADKMTMTDDEVCCSTGDYACEPTPSSSNCEGSDDCPTQTPDCQFA